MKYRMPYLNLLALKLYYLPTLMLALLMYASIPLLILAGLVFPKTATALMQAGGRWADRKNKDVEAAYARLSRGTSE